MVPPAEALGARPPRAIAETVCREAGDLCIEQALGEEELQALVALELAVIETYSLLAEELGLNAIEECLKDDTCLENMVDTSREATNLYLDNKYFFRLTVQEVKKVVEYLRRSINP